MRDIPSLASSHGPFAAEIREDVGEGVIRQSRIG